MTDETAKHTDWAKDFYLKEYECLRKEIMFLLKDCRDLERNVVVAVGISWAWLLDKNAMVPRWAWWIPCLFAALGAVRVWGIMKSFGVYRLYVGGVEEAIVLPDGPGGWEHFLGSQVIIARGIQKRFPKAKIDTSKFAFVFWAILIFATVAVALFERCR